MNCRLWNAQMPVKRIVEKDSDGISTSTELALTFMLKCLLVVANCHIYLSSASV